jgi:hypothetical protein
MILRVCIFPWHEYFVAQCLEYDIATQAGSVEAVKEAMLTTMLAQLELTRFLGLEAAPERHFTAWHAKRDAVADLRTLSEDITLSFREVDPPAGFEAEREIGLTPEQVDFALKEPFEIDGEELDGLSPQQCFVLGVEWMSTVEWVERKEGGQLTIHRRNRGRIVRLARRRGVELLWEDLDDGWSVVSMEKQERERAAGELAE